MGAVPSNTRLALGGYTSSPMKGGGDGVIEFGHIERLVLTILESVLPDSDVFGYLTIPIGNTNTKYPSENSPFRIIRLTVLSFMVLMETEQL